MKRLFYIAFAALSLLVCRSNGILLEAELFENKGGWTVDAQFMDQMGSPYLLAHGIGTPVQDASTSFKVDKAGKYTVWARTYNWNSPWDVTKAPGLFQLAFDGKLIDAKLGTCGAWQWQKAGQVQLSKGTHKLALKDLTGFEGRCDAVFLSLDENAELPASPRYDISKASNGGSYDVVVVGAGVGGVVTAVSASRIGLKALLISNRPVLGGNNSPEVRVSPVGALFQQPYPKMGTVLSEIGSLMRNYDSGMSVIKLEKNLKIVYDQNVVKVSKKGDAIASAYAYDITTGKIVEYTGKVFVDCTGDGNLGYAAGAEFMMGRETNDVFNETLAPSVPGTSFLGSSMYWTSAKETAPSTFPVCDWMVKFNSETAQKVTRSVWYWETGFHDDQIIFAERNRDYLLKIFYSNWAYLKNAPETKDEYANLRMNWTGHVLGKRESRRLLGDYVVTQNDVEGKVAPVPDAAAICTYTMDQHFPRPENTVQFPGQEWMSIQKHNHNPQGSVPVQIPGENINFPYPIPLRALYSKNVSNMFIASRCISVSHVASASTRSMAAIALEGEAVALAASLCVKYNCQARDIYNSHLPEFKSLLEKGLPVRVEQKYHPHAHLGMPKKAKK